MLCAYIWFIPLPISSIKETEDDTADHADSDAHKLVPINEGSENEDRVWKEHE